MTLSRDKLLADGDAAIQAALDETRRVANLTHAELVIEAIHKAIVAIETHRLNCKIVGELFPAIEPIRNDDLAPALRLRLRLLAAWREWNENS